MAPTKSKSSPKKERRNTAIHKAAQEARDPSQKKPFFPMGKIHLRISKAINRSVDPKVVVYLTAVLEYVAAELLEISGNECLRLKPLDAVRIQAQNVMNAIKTDDELSALIKTTE